MPLDVPELPADGQDGFDFINVLRGCLGCAIIVIDARRKITAFNAKAEALTALKAKNVLDQSSSLLAEPLQKIFEETFSNGKSVGDRQIILPGEDNLPSTIQVNSSILGSESGKVTGVVLVLNDVSSVRRWESNMRRLDRVHSVGTLSASMAHEVKNAFVAIRTFVDLLLEKNQQAELAGIVRQEMSRIDSILRQMRKFSGPAQPEFSLIRLHLILEKSLQLIQHLLSEKNIKLVRSFSASSDTVNGNQDQLEQAFINLFFNALDAMKPGGTLTVSTRIIPPGLKIPGVSRKNGPWLQITIQDNGVGISPENMQRLFEPFFTTKPDGTGLGLAITRRILQEHQGAVVVESVPGKGSSFILVVPSGSEHA